MKKNNWTFILLVLTTMFGMIFFVRCGCKEETVRYFLNEYEKTIMPIIESEFFELSFNNLNKLLFVKIEKTYNDRTIFEIHENNIDELVSSNLYTIENLDTQDLEQNLTNISIDGFQYNNVFVFKLSSNSINIESEFETIVFSPKEGIVFLKKRAGGYLKRN